MTFQRRSVLRKIIKITLISLVSVVVALGGTLAVLFFGFHVDPFDRSGWKIIEDKTYYRTYRGRHMTGWQEIDGKWYYLDPFDEGAMVTGWQKIGDGQYYLTEDGSRHSGWLTQDENTYYMLPEDGRAATGWQEIDGMRYYFDEEGRTVSGWVELEKRYYLDETGKAYQGWLEQDGEKFLLNNVGAIVTGWIQTQQGLCYLDPVTGALSTGWVDTPEGRFYLNEEGYPASGWTDTTEGRCFLNEKGQPTTGWMEENGKRYHFGDNGLMTLGWLEQDGERYYFKEDGTMAIGKVDVDGTARFFTSTGKYVVLTNKWNPVPDDYQAELVKYDTHQVSAQCRDQLTAMIEQIKPLGYYKVTNIYRSQEDQQAIWNRRVNSYLLAGYSKTAAEEEVGKSVCIPGTSEHQLGLAVDIDGVPAVHGWLAEHSWEYGFIVRYPEGKSDITGILYEPWHFRYVGVELAKELYDLGLCMEEYMDMLTAQSLSSDT